VSEREVHDYNRDQFANSRHIQRAQARPSQDLLRPENYLEVGLTPDEREIVINHPAASREGHIVFSPAQARHLAKLLLRKADECKP
jgi:hypothetical protein